MSIRPFVLAAALAAAAAVPAASAAPAVCDTGTRAAAACLPRCQFHPICDELPWNDLTG
ncbi:MAG TPA: hypothetical protein VF519_12720 [Mycobacteriales bacterium]